MRARLMLLPLVLSLNATPSLAATVSLLKDINPVPAPDDSFPRNYASAGDLAYFAATDGDRGVELWRTDGTAEGTFQLLDGCPGPCSGNPEVLAQSGGSVFFHVFPASFGVADLWMTDGSVAGTVRLATRLLIPEFRWVASQGQLYFLANDLVHGAELWCTDGTPAGTALVKDIRPGFAPAGLTELTVVGDRLYFAADDGVHGPALWTSDGTEEGTFLVRDPLPRADHKGPAHLRAVGSSLFFAAPTSRSSDGLWRLPAVDQKPLLLFELAAGPEDLVFLGASVVGGQLVFAVDEPGRGHELWASNGTKGGTRRLTRLAAGARFVPQSDPDGRLLPATALGGRLVFGVFDPLRGAEPWVTDGTPDGTRLLRDTCPGPCSGLATLSASSIVNLPGGDTLFFTADNGPRGIELWATDGTPAGTRLVRDLCRGACGSEPFGLAPADGQLFLYALNVNRVPQLWRSDATSQGTVRLTGFPTFNPLTPSLGITVGDLLVLTVHDAAHGRELWRSDGTRAGTGLVADLNTEDLSGSFPNSFQVAGAKTWFLANDGANGRELWASDGTQEGTVLVHEFTPGPAGTPIQILSSTDSDGRLFFVARLVEPRFSFWRSDGAPGGTVRLTPPTLQVVASEVPAAVGDLAFFVGDDGVVGEELWVSDGTAEGTRLVADLVPGPVSSAPSNLTTFAGRLFFTALTTEFGRELWTSDGTTAGTMLFKDVDPRPGVGSVPDPLVVHDGRLFFVAADEKHGRELWVSDGTPDGTHLSVEIVPGGDGIFADLLLTTGTKLFFSGGPANQILQGLWITDGTSGGTRQLSRRLLHTEVLEIGSFNGDLYFATEGDQVLWKSDGTEEGTITVLTADGLEIDEAEYFQTVGGKLYFTTGPEGVMYESDGTEAGTGHFLSLAAPSESGVSFELVPAGDRFLFRRWDPTTGSELWALQE